MPAATRPRLHTFSCCASPAGRQWPQKAGAAPSIAAQLACKCWCILHQACCLLSCSLQRAEFRFHLQSRTTVSSSLRPCRATEAANAQREAEEAHARYDRAKARLRALEEEKAQIADKATALDRSQQSITAKEADMNVLQR